MLETRAEEVTSELRGSFLAKLGMNAAIAGRGLKHSTSRIAANMGLQQDPVEDPQAVIGKVAKSGFMLLKIVKR